MAETPRRPDAAALERMHERWRAFAREDARHYVAANRKQWDTEAFYAMGKGLAEEIVAWAGEAIGRRRMLEIGCGAGRMLVAFAPHFDSVDGVDISTEMLDEARPHMPANVHLHSTDGADLRAIGDRSIDLVVSIQVFQHVPDRDVIASYLAETERVLGPGGRAILQFDSRRAIARCGRSFSRFPIGCCPEITAATSGVTRSVPDGLARPRPPPGSRSSKRRGAGTERAPGDARERRPG